MPQSEITTVNVQILARMGWLSGTLHLSAGQSLMQHLSAGGRLISLTQVTLPERRQLVDFLALRKAHIALVIPGDEMEEVGDDVAGEQVEHHVRCILEQGQVSGLLRGPAATRLSDFLRDREGLFVLRQAFYRGGSDETTTERHISLAIVNDEALTAVTEWLEEGWSSGGHPPPG